MILLKSGGPLGLSIVGGSDHASHPFGINEPGVFISKVELLKSSAAPHYPTMFPPTFSCPISSSGDPARSGMSKWTACRRQNIGGEYHRPASCHTPGSCARTAVQQAGDPNVSAEGPFTTWDAGEVFPHKCTADNPCQ